MAERRKVPNNARQQEIQRLQREAHRAATTAGGQGARRAKKLKEEARTIQRGAMQRKKTTASDLAGARTKKAGSGELAQLEQRLKKARSQGKSMLASQLRKRIAAVKRGMAQ